MNSPITWNGLPNEVKTSIVHFEKKRKSNTKGDCFFINRRKLYAARSCTWSWKVAVHEVVFVTFTVERSKNYALCRPWWFCFGHNASVNVISNRIRYGRVNKYNVKYYIFRLSNDLNEHDFHNQRLVLLSIRFISLIKHTINTVCSCEQLNFTP